MASGLVVPRSIFLAVSAALLAFGARSLGQMQAVEAYYAVVAEKAPMRSGDYHHYYAVTDLSAGRVVRVDGEGNGWSRIAYPAGVPAAVVVGDVRELGGGQLEVRRKTALKSYSGERGLMRSWQRLLPAGHELEVGDRLDVVEPLRDGTGSLAGYLVTPPSAARGYVESASLRRATPEEIASYRESLGGAETPASTGGETDLGGDSEKPTGEGETVVITPPTPEPAIETDVPVASTGGASDDSLLEPMQPPSSDGSDETAEPVAPPTTEAPTTGQPQPLEGDATGDSSSEPEAMIDTGAAPAMDALDEAEALRQRLGQLNAKFEAVRRQSSGEAELTAMIAEFDRAIAEENLSEGSRSALQARVELLRFQLDVRKRSQELEDRQRAINEDAAQLDARVNEARRAGGYLLVGRLAPSLVYDGQRVPLMYRVISVGASSPRTLAYIQPDDRFELESKIGRVVGVSGSDAIDPALQLRLVRPSRVDVLRADVGGS